MKIEYSEDALIIYIHRYEASMDFTNKSKVEQYFRGLFLKLKKYYGIELSGYYNIEVYYDKVYGAIIQLEKEELDYYPSFDETLDMRISIISDQSILYKIEEYTREFKGKWYFYKDQYYLKIEKPVEKKKMGNLLEMSIPVYGEEAKEAVQYGRELKQ